VSEHGSSQSLPTAGWPSLGARPSTTVQLSDRGDPCTRGGVPDCDNSGDDERGDQALRGSETILVVDDDRLVLRLAREFLSEAGYTVLQAGGVEEALDVVETWPGFIALLITDLVMPQMNGFQLGLRTRGLRPDTRVLLISGSPIQMPPGDGFFESFLRKPFTRRQLLRRVRAILDVPGH
jgi:CheY-like chemotaxis protein